MSSAVDMGIRSGKGVVTSLTREVLLCLCQSIVVRSELNIRRLCSIHRTGNRVNKVYFIAHFFHYLRALNENVWSNRYD